MGGPVIEYETVAASRRVPFPLYDTNGDEYTGTAPTGAEVQISISGAAWQQASGTVTKLRDGDFYYEATQGETIGRGFRLLRLAKAGIDTTVVDWYVGERRVNDPDAIARRIPIYLEDTNGDAVAGLTLSGAEIEVSAAGSAFAAGAGTAEAIGLGAYYYQPAASEYATRGALLMNVNDAAAEEYKFETEIGINPSSAPTGTAAASIRDRIATVITALTPTRLASDKFREYRNESAAFIEWCEANPVSAFRRFQVTESGSDEPPETSSVMEEERKATFQVIIAYPQNSRAGSQQSLDRQDMMREDQRIIERAIGMTGAANFTSPYPSACWLSGGTDRDSGEACDYLILSQVMSFIVEYD